jgi:hypothetical protein
MVLDFKILMLIIYDDIIVVDEYFEMNVNMFRSDSTEMLATYLLPL